MKNNHYPKIPSLEVQEKNLATRDEMFWIQKGEHMALDLFQKAAIHVPAYKDFLRQRGVRPEKIKSIRDFASVPMIDKKNYLSHYPLSQLCWDGKLSALDMISASSGSSGTSTFWPRGAHQDTETILTHELFLRDSFAIHKKKTLFVVTFAMGMWVAGTLTYRVMQAIAEKYDLTVITPGIDSREVIAAIKKLGPDYEQIIIAGYPPFLKDVVDLGSQEGIRWDAFHVNFLFAAESFSETWRDYIAEKVGIKNVLSFSLNIYGTADALILAHETPISILARRRATLNAPLYSELFENQERVPTLAQYNPMLRYFEEDDGKILFSAWSGIPLIRYAIGDTGGLISFSKMEEHFRNHSDSLVAEARKAKISQWKLPFVFVFGRNDFTASLYGLNIYPETIRGALEHQTISSYLTGKFTMIVRNDEHMDQYLEVHVETQRGASKQSKKLTSEIQKRLIETLCAQNQEFRALRQSLGSRTDPHIILHAYGDSSHFRPGAKQRWLTKE